jgi:predicted CXXCH cytochrome family protein
MRATLATIALVLIAILAAGCSKSSSSGSNASFAGTVVDGTGAGVAGATVYLIPANKVDTSTILNDTVLNGEAEKYDEPLEDAADSGDPAIASAVTSGGGSFFFPLVQPGSYFVFVRPAVTDTAHLPGGDLCRKALSHVELGVPRTIKLSGRPSDQATFVGTSTCLVCHEDAYGNHKYTGHALGIMKTGDPASLQDPSRYPDFFNGLARFTSAAAYTDPNVTVLYCEDFDSTRGFDKFKIFEGATGGGTVQMRAYLWQDSTSSVYKITIENRVVTTQAPVTYDVTLTYGGSVHKQRFMIKIPGRNGHYPILQYQTEGKNTHYDRTRKVFRDYHLDWLWDDSNNLLRLPDPLNTFEGNCAGCHLPNYTPSQHQTTNEWVASSVSDSVGSNYDIDGDTIPDELNVGCEKCHGPGSEHIGAGGPRSIVAISRISPSRANQICGFCHDRQIGNGTGLVNDTPLNQSNRFPRAGIRRADYLKDYTTRMGPAASEIWKDIDAIHARSHNAQFADLLKSKHFRNARRLVVCSDCHDTHDKKYPAQLKYGLGPESPLCQRCHTIDVTEHMAEKIGTTMTGSVTSCVACHMVKTARTGAGRMGLTLAPPTGQPSDENIVYWENDITSHNMIVPSKFTAFGSKPGQAMPAPYVNACGHCHVGGTLASIDPFDSAACGRCHAEVYGEWRQSGHADVVATFKTTTNSFYAGSCFRCHIGQQFILERVAGDSTYSGSLPYPGPASQECVICHYPHFGNANASSRLRMEGKVLLPEGPTSNPSAGTYIEMGKGRLCVFCHNSRTSDPESRAVATWNSSASEWRLAGTPHAANQGETYLGFGAVTSFSTAGLDETTISDTLHATQDFTLPGSDRKYNGCVTCHMHKGKSGEPHKWEPVIEVCAICHRHQPDWILWGGAPTPSFHKPARGDYDGDGTIEDIEHEYEGLLERLIAGLTNGTGSGIGNPELGFGFTWLGGHPYWSLGTNQQSPPDADAAKVAWNLVLFEHDPAAAFHNPAYAFQVLRASWMVLGRKLLQNNAWVPPGNEWTDL